MEQDISYSLGNGTKLGYSSTSDGEKTYLKGIKSIPAIGGTPDEVDTDSLDNLKYHTTQDGLQPAIKMEIPFNMEDPTAEANIKLVYDLAEAGTPYYWSVEYTNGIKVQFRSKVRYSINETNSNELLGFTMYLSAIGEPETTIPTGE
jgi:hypothetical protein